MVQRVLDSLALFFTRVTLWCVASMPESVALAVLQALIRLAHQVNKRWQTSSRRNLQQVFPNLSEAERKRILDASMKELARFFYDSARLSKVERAWIERNVDCTGLRNIIAVSKTEKKGIILATGHIGSFELFAHAFALLGMPIAVVARSFKLPRLNAWWNAVREMRGNNVIDRNGAFKEMVKALNAGRSVGILFDQNVKRNHAVFIDLFGAQAATTKSLALASLKTGAMIALATMKYDHVQGKYIPEIVPQDYSSIRECPDLSVEQKVHAITQKLSDAFAKKVLEFPEGWFWGHRRWKTRPEGEAEAFYR